MYYQGIRRGAVVPFRGMVTFMTSIRIGIRIFLLVAGVSMMILGFANGEPGVILRKAVIVCLECIGVG